MLCLTKIFIAVLMVFHMIPLCSHAFAEPLIVDHTCTDITRIPQSAIEQVKTKLHIVYGHTSHGSQLTTGMTGLVEFSNGGGLGLSLPANIFQWNNGGTNGALDLHDRGMAGDVGYYPQWVNETRSYLDDPSHSDVNVVIWSWCGQASGRTDQSMIDTYWGPMSQLEAEYPNVTFVYMTGHADGTGETGNLHLRNQQIREYCVAHNKVLFDFYDIEIFDPNGNYFGNKEVNDNCDYDSDANGTRDRNWAQEWQNAHTQNVDWYHCSSAHSQPLNANRKAYAAWWLWARLAGWHHSGNQFVLTVNTEGSGSVTLNPNPYNNIYTAGEEVILTAVAESGWVFGNWQGDVADSQNPTTLMMNTDKQVTATFVHETGDQYGLTVSIKGEGSVILDPAGGIYEPGTEVTLSALPGNGEGAVVFSGWDGDINGTQNPKAIIMDDSKTIMATFVSIRTDHESHLTRSQVIHCDDITDITNMPEDLPYGLIDLEVDVENMGGTAILTIQLPSPAPDGYRWYKYGYSYDPDTQRYESNRSWYDFSAHAVFNDARDEVTLTLIDGRIGDDDRVVNGRIVDPSGLGFSSSVPSSVQEETGTEKSSGCFINMICDGWF